MIGKFLKEKFGIESYVYCGKCKLYLHHLTNNRGLYIEFDLKRVGCCFEMYIDKPGHVLVTIPFLTVSFDWW